MILHDINLSARYADYIFALYQGKLVAEGEPSNVFGLDCTVIEDPVSGTPSVVPIGRYHVNREKSFAVHSSFLFDCGTVPSTVGNG